MFNNSNVVKATSRGRVAKYHTVGAIPHSHKSKQQRKLPWPLCAFFLFAHLFLVLLVILGVIERTSLLDVAERMRHTIDCLDACVEDGNSG